MRREGKCNICGTCCMAERDWSIYLKDIGDYPKERTQGCPNLAPINKQGERHCLIYGTEHHWFWEESCNACPTIEKDLENAVLWFRNHPECSLEYVEV